MLRIITMAMIVWLAGCTSVSPLTPQVTYYLLDDFPQAAPAQTLDTAALVVQVDRIAVPEYLTRSNLVMRKTNKEMVFANYHSWADSLPTAMQRVLITELNKTSENVVYGRHCPMAACPTLRLVVDHFYPTEAGDVILSGQYVFTNNAFENNVFADNHRATAAVPFLLKQALSSGGYNESVQRMRQLLGQLAQQITERSTNLQQNRNAAPKADTPASSVENTGVVF